MGGSSAAQWIGAVFGGRIVSCPLAANSLLTSAESSSLRLFPTSDADDSAASSTSASTDVLVGTPCVCWLNRRLDVSGGANSESATSTPTNSNRLTSACSPPLPIKTRIPTSLTGSTPLCDQVAHQRCRRHVVGQGLGCTSLCCSLRNLHVRDRSLGDRPVNPGAGQRHGKRHSVSAITLCPPADPARIR